MKDWRPEGGPRVLCRSAKQIKRRVELPHFGHGGGLATGRHGGTLATATPNWTAAPRWNCTRIRLALAVGWQNP